MQSKNESLEKDVQDKENFIRKLKEESQELLGKTEENEQKLESLLKCQQEKEATLKSKIQELNQRIEEQQRDLETSDRRNDNLKFVINKIEAEKSDLMKQLAGKTEDYEMLVKDSEEKSI